MTTHFRRRKYLINYRLQLKYTFMVIVLVSILMILSLAGLYYSMWGSIIEEFSEQETQDKLEQIDRISGIQEARERSIGRVSMPKFLREANMLSAHQKEQLHGIIQRSRRNLVPKVFILLLLVGVVSIFITHRIAGPIFRIKNVLRKFNEGQFHGSLFLRKGDQFKDLAKELNDLIQKQLLLEKEHQSLVSEIADLSKSLQKQDCTPQECAKKLADIQQQFAHDNKGI